jgi:hypothetical protein
MSRGSAACGIKIAGKPPGPASEIDRDKKLIILDPRTGPNMILALGL